MNTAKLITEIFIPQQTKLIVEGKTPDGRMILKGKLQEANIIKK